MVVIMFSGLRYYLKLWNIDKGELFYDIRGICVILFVL